MAGYDASDPDDSRKKDNEPKPHPRDEARVEWTASEYIMHNKDARWYALLTLAVLAAGVLVYALTRDKMSTAVILLAGLVFGIAAGRKPRVMAYRLDETGLTIGQKSYPYSLFRSFAIQKEGAFATIVFLPLKRFMPAYTLYFAPEDGEHIITVLANYLPMEQRDQGLLESFVHRIRF